MVGMMWIIVFFFFSSRRRHTRLQGDWSSDVCSSDLHQAGPLVAREVEPPVAFEVLEEVLEVAALRRRQALLGRRFALGGFRLGFVGQIGRASCRERV